MATRGTVAVPAAIAAESFLCVTTVLMNLGVSALNPFGYETLRIRLFFLIDQGVNT